MVIQSADDSCQSLQSTTAISVFKKNLQVFSLAPETLLYSNIALLKTILMPLIIVNGTLCGGSTSKKHDLHSIGSPTAMS